MPKFNVLVVGAGVMGRNHIRNYIAQNANVTAVDVSGACLAKAKEQFPSIKTYDDIDKAIKAGNIDAASVVTTTSSHFDVARKLIENNIGVLVEKPMTDSLDKARELVKISKNSGVVVQVGHIERFNPAVRKLKDMKSDLGKIVYASAHRFGVPSARKLDNVIMDLSIHDIDILSFLTGEKPKSVFGVQRSVLEERGDLSSLIFEFGSFVASVESNTVSPIKTRELYLGGTDGCAKVSYIDQDLVMYKPENTKYSYNSFDELTVRIGRGTEIHPFIRKEEPLKLELESFVSCVKNGTSPVVTAEDGMDSILIAEAAIRSAKTGRKELIEF